MSGKALATHALKFDDAPGREFWLSGFCGLEIPRQAERIPYRTNWFTRPSVGWSPVRNRICDGKDHFIYPENCTPAIPRAERFHKRLMYR